MKTILKKNDTVVALTGKDKGKSGKVLRIDTEKSRVVVEKLNVVKRHRKPTQASPQGGIVEKELSIAISNVALMCKKCDKGVRVARKVLEDGSKVRICKKCGETI